MSEAPHRKIGHRTLVRLFCCVLALSSCQESKEAAAPPPNPFARQLAGARVDAARNALGKNQPGEALLLLVSALKADPAFPEPLQLLRPLLAETRWQYPAAIIDAGIPIEHAVLRSNSLWTSVSDPEAFNTTARWNLDTLTVESVLFPRPAERTQALILSPDATHAVITRTSADRTTTLLCNAETLAPIHPLDDRDSTEIPPSHLTVFSPDNLLLAHPELHEETVVWHLRDLATGEILRSHSLPSLPSTTAVRFENRTLKIERADQSLIEIPVSPSEPVTQKQGALSREDPPPPPLFKIQGSKIELARLLPSPKTTGRGIKPVPFDPSRLPTLVTLAEALTGLRFDEEKRTFTPLSESTRRAAISSCDPARLATLLDGLDFTNVASDLTGQPFRTASPDAAFRLHDRISRANPSANRFLALSVSPPGPSPEDEVAALFEKEDSGEILAAIPNFPARSPAAATAFKLSLESAEPTWLTAAIVANQPLPPLLDRIARSRLAWLENRHADALAYWADGFPDLETSLRTEDWGGWESNRFGPIVSDYFHLIRAELASYEISPGASATDRQTITARLLDPETSRAIGRSRHALACLAAAQACAPTDDHALALDLVVMARALGAPPAPSYRAEAIAHTQAGEFSRARETWISLITHSPVESHEANDYAEAAYTSFENGDAEQAMAILNTGLHRFPDDPEFSYRAGWIFLITGRPQEAYSFLLNGKRIGFGEDIVEKATALLAIAASQSDAVEDSENFHQQLVALNSEWSVPDPPQAADWPDGLKSTLRAFVEPPKAIIVDEEMQELPEINDLPATPEPLPLPE